MGQPTASWIDAHARRVPDRTALVDLASGRSRTYAELAQRVRSVAAGLAARGIRAGDRVAVLSRNDARTFEVLHACTHLGAICVLLNWRLAADELAAITADARPSLLLAESAAADTAAGLGVTDQVLWASESGDPDGYEALAATPLDGWEPTAVDEDAPWTILYTSGTTGLPKGVIATHRSTFASVLGIAVAGEVSASTRCLTVLPTFHVAGLALYANAALLMGGTALVMRQFEPAEALALLTRTDEPITHFCGVPANYQFMQQLPEFAGADLRGVVAAVGGAPVPQPLVETWTAHGAAMTTVYGITEAGATVLAVPPQRALDKNGTVGVPLLHARCRVRTPDGADAAPGEIGELQISGPLVTPGYWERPEATAQALGDDGWLRTGDAARLDADGFLVLVDRWKDMYISGGENVYPAEVENVLAGHPEIAQVAVIGVPDERWGETGVAYIVAAAGTAPDPVGLRDWCAARIARYKVPARVQVVAELPRNATGKVLKTRLRELDTRR